MNLTIKQSTDRTEQVSSSLVDKLYQLTKPDSVTGLPMASAILVGRVQTPAAYEDAVNFLNTQFSVAQDNGSDFQVSVLNNNYYIRFADSAVEEVLKLNMDKDEGEGITVAEASNTVADYFQGNVDIESFDELKYFKTGNYNFNGCTNLESVDITDKYGRFNNCTNLVNWYGGRKPDGYLYLGNPMSGAQSCPGLTELEIGEEATSLWNNQFEGSINIEILRCKPVVNYQFGYPAFRGGSVKNVYIENMDNWLTCRTYGSGMIDSNTKIFYNNQLVTSVEIPQTLTQIGTNSGGCFAEYRHLTSVQFHSGIISITHGTFNNCTNLVIQDLNLPNLVTLGDYAFKGTKIQTISDLGSVTSISSHCFESCSLLTNVALPASCNSIGNDAFKSCNALTRVDIPDLNSWLNINFGNYTANPVWLSRHLFINGCEPTKILPYGSTVNGTTELTFPQGITALKPQVFRGVSSLLEVVIPSLITSIPEGGFCFCTSLTSVACESLGAITSIGPYAFEGCDLLLSIDLSNVTSIGRNAFQNCENLSSVDLSNATSIGGNAFSGCTNLTRFYGAGSAQGYFDMTNVSLSSTPFDGCMGLTSVTLPSNLTVMKNWFKGSGIVDIVIPDSVTSIEGLVFQSCTAMRTCVIGTGIQSIGSNVWHGSNIGNDRVLQITIKATTPPSIVKTDQWTFNYIGDFVIYVPAGTDPVSGKTYVDIYKEAWGRSSTDTYLFDRIQAMPTT